MLIALDDHTSSLAALMARAKGGDDVAFERLTRDEVPGLYRVAWLIVRDESAAADALQDALFRAWRDLRNLRDPASLQSWLRRLTVNASYDIARRRGRQRVRELPLDASSRTFAAPDQTTLDQDTLRQGFMDLSPEYRAVVVLRYYLDLPLGEIATSLGVPEGTVKSRLHHAMRIMRAGIEAAEREPQPDSRPGRRT